MNPFYWNESKQCWRPSFQEDTEFTHEQALEALCDGIQEVSAKILERTQAALDKPTDLQ